MLNDTALGYFNWGSSGSLIIGDSTNTGDITINTARTYTKTVEFISSTTGDIILSGNLTSSIGSGNAFVLASGKNFVNSSSRTINSGSGRWVIYSVRAVDDTPGGLSQDQTIFGNTYGTLAPGSITGPTYNATQNTWVFVDAGLTITITADDVTRNYGSVNPTFTYTFSCSTGCSAADAVTGTATISTTATSASNVGDYTLTTTIGTLALTGAYSGYTLNLVNGTLTVAPATLNVNAEAKSKTYATANPALTYTYSGLVNGDTSSVFSGALATTAVTGSNVGNYAITQGTLSAGSNYTINYTSANLSVTAATLTVEADAKSKTYGAANPSLTYTYSGLVNGDTAGVFSGGLTTTAGTGSNVGTYAINQGSLSAGSNYTISYTGADLTINPAALTVNAEAKSKAYGDANPAFTYTYSGLTNGDTATVFSGALTSAATAASPIGTYAITQGTLSAGSNYTITYNAADLTVTPYGVTVTADALNKTYGAANPTLTYTYSALANGDDASIFSGSLATAATASSNAGTYAITQGTLAANSNYTITYVGANLTVDPATLTVNADAKSKTYGTANPSLTYTYSGLVNGDTSAVLSGGLTTTALTSSNVGDYAITQGTLSAGSNYTISYTGADLTINPATLTVNAEAKSKAYGDAVPSLTYTYSGLTNGDTVAVFSGDLATTATASSNVGTYGITQGTLTAGSNYAITYNGANLTVTAYGVTVTADAQSKTYGSPNPTLTYTYSALANGDTASIFTGGLTTAATASSGVGTYAINQGTLSAGSNYTITYVGDNLTVNPATLNVNAEAKSKTYGAVNPSLTYTYSGLVNGDTASVLSGSLATAATTGSNAGTYAITQGTLSASSNYTINYTGADLTINPATLTVNAEAKSRGYGQANPALTYTYSGLTNGDTAAVFSGGLATVADATSNVGTYAITQGTLSAGGNYAIAYNSANLTVTAYAVTVTADALNKTYGQANPALTYTYSALANGDTAAIFTGALATTATTSSNAGTYAITQGTLSAGSNYTLTYVGSNLVIDPATLNVTADAQTKTYGQANPALTYTYSGLTNGDSASVISGGLATAATASSNVGTYAITQGTLTAGSNYTINYTGADLDIDPASLTIRAEDKVRQVGQANPTLTYVFSGFTNGDSQATAVTGTPTLSTAADGMSPNGTYAINIGNGTLSVSPNYNVTLLDGTLTIGKVNLTVTVNNATKTYGSANPTFGVTYSGFLNGDTTSVLMGAPVLTSAADASSIVGAYGINIAIGDLTAVNYNFVLVGGTLNVTPASLVITANSVNTKVNGSIPSFGATYSGFVNGQNASVVSGLQFTSNYQNRAGTYSITPYGASAANYNITYVNGVLRVESRRREMPQAIMVPLVSKEYPSMFINNPTSFSKMVSNDDSNDDLKISPPQMQFSPGKQVYYGTIISIDPRLANVLRSVSIW